MPSKLGGVSALLGSILILLLLPLLSFQLMKGLAFYGPVKLFYWSLVVVFVLLTVAGGWPSVDPYLLLTRVLSVLYYSYFMTVGIMCKLWDLSLS